MTLTEVVYWWNMKEFVVSCQFHNCQLNTIHVLIQATKMKWFFAVFSVHQLVV